MMNVVVGDEIFFIHILGPRAVAAEQDAGATHLLDMIAGDLVILSMQVHTDRSAATVGKVTLLDRAILRPPQANQCIGLIQHVPVVLQAGIILGRLDLIAQIESHPLMRSYRVDKLVLLALEATLRHYIDPQSAAAHIPTLAMMRASTETLAERARTLEQLLASAMPDERFLVGSDVSYAGGGSLPGEGLPTVVIRWQPSYAPVDAIATALRRTHPPVIARIRDGALCFDLRTLAQNDFEPLVTAVTHTLPDDADTRPPS